MSTLQGININSTNVTQMNLGKPQLVDKFTMKLLELPPQITAEESQAQLAHQNSIPQTTVIENNDEILAVLGDNGWRTTFSNADSFDVNLSKEQLIDSFKNKYGSSLTVHQYSKDNAPTMGEIHEKVYGRPPTPKIDYYA
jgi:hypothetical protein